MKQFEINELLSRITASCLGVKFLIKLQKDKKYADSKGDARLYLQVFYISPCTKTEQPEWWSGRKWYLSSYMTYDEIVKTAWCAVKSAVEHEVMEGFKVDGKILFNPHLNFEELLKISDKEVKRS